MLAVAMRSEVVSIDIGHQKCALANSLPNRHPMLTNLVAPIVSVLVDAYGAKLSKAVDQPQQPRKKPSILESAPRALNPVNRDATVIYVLAIGIHEADHRIV